MSAQFLSRVRLLFSLMDIDGDSLLSPPECYYSFNQCFHQVHQARMAADPEETLSNKEKTLAQQVDWLFNAASLPATEEGVPQERAPSPSPSPSPSRSINLASFELCYNNLLKSAYEEEVLTIDLNRAIEALQHSEEMKQARALVEKGKRLWSNVMKSGSEREGLKRGLSSILGKSGCMGPKKQTQCRKLVEEYFNRMSASSSSSNNEVDGLSSQSSWTSLLLQLLNAGADVGEMTRDMDAALQ